MAGSFDVQPSAKSSTSISTQFYWCAWPIRTLTKTPMKCPLICILPLYVWYPSRPVFSFLVQILSFSSCQLLDWSLGTKAICMGGQLRRFITEVILVVVKEP